MEARAHFKFCVAAGALSLAMLWMGPVQARRYHKLADPYVVQNNIPPRWQWANNKGYCGEVSLISAGLYYGQYISQYEARAIALKNGPQNKDQLLLGKNDAMAASQMHLNAVEWDTASQETPEQFYTWVKEQVIKGYPVAIGIFMNEYLFNISSKPNAGDSEYDHIVPVIGIASNYVLSDPTYHGDDVLTFSDNGLYGDDVNPPYIFRFGFDAFLADREQANAKDGSIYSLNNDASNYGIVITGVMDKNGDTVPVRVDTNLNFEHPVMENGNTPPPPMPLVLTITVSGLAPNVPYILYRYNSLDKVPDREI